ncbi:MAG: fructose PTS transporter subunit IIA [Anaerostipes sp.]|jgi:PTS system fructose-specific IIA component|nr:fructose PTS transporter subunit IIA [Anaerostipes sp.]
MEVRDVLDERVIDFNMKAVNKREAITHLAKKLQEAGYIDDLQEYVEDIYLRESEGQTGIGNYIAIPHGKSGSVSQVGIAIGKMEQEIEWETLDDKGVKLVFLFAVGKDNENARDHLVLLAEVARKLGNDEAVEEMLQAKNIEDLKSIFS